MRHLDGHSYSITSNKILSDEDVLVIKNEGMPYYNNNRRYDGLFVSRFIIDLAICMFWSKYSSLLPLLRRKSVWSKRIFLIINQWIIDLFLVVVVIVLVNCCFSEHSILLDLLMICTIVLFEWLCYLISNKVSENRDH